MKKFTKFSLIIVAAMASLGILLCGISTVMGGGYREIRQMAKNGDFDFGNWHFGTGIFYNDDDDYDNDDKYYNSDGTDTAIQSFKAASVLNMDLDIGAASLYVKKSSDLETITVSLERGHEKYYNCSLEGDTLRVGYNVHNNYTYLKKAPKITIEVPKDLKLESLMIDIGASAAEFSVKNITCTDLSIDVGAGAFSAEGFEVKEHMDVIVGAGALKIKDGEYKDITLDCGVGSLSLEGKVSGNITGECDLGKMELDLEGKETDYNYDLSCDLGDLEVNGYSYSGIDKSRQIMNEGAVGTMELSCSLGKIEVDID